MKIETCAVIVKAENGKCYQVALTQDMVDVLLRDLRFTYFTGNSIKVLDTPLDVDLITADNQDDIKEFL